MGFVVRFVRRVRPLFRLLPDEPDAEQHLNSLDQAIDDAENVCLPIEVGLRNLEHRLRHDAAHAHILSHVPRIPVSADVAIAVARACTCAEAIIQGKPETVVRFATSTIQASLSAASKKGVSVDVETAAEADYAKLIENNLGQFPELGELFDLGPLWPAGEPPWWQKA